MNVWDILILLAVAGLVYLAVRAMRSGKSRCSCGCDACGKKCECKKTQKDGAVSKDGPGKKE